MTGKRREENFISSISYSDHVINSTETGRAKGRVSATQEEEEKKKKKEEGEDQIGKSQEFKREN